MKKTVLLLALVLLPPSLQAQNTGTGLPPFGSFTSGGFDVINNQDLNATFSIPLVSSTGRGMPLSLSLVYNSNMYQITNGAWTSVTNSSGNPTWGWVEDMPKGGFLSWTTSSGVFKCGGSTCHLSRYFDYTYTDALGTVHPAPVSITCSPGCGGVLSAYTSDNTGYYVNASANPPFGTVTGPGGQLVTS